MHLPKLTDNEHTLLMDNHGCLKCHHLFEYHVSKDCTNDWPDAVTYHTITAAAAKVGKIRKNVTAAIIPTTGSTASTSTVAAIVTPHPVAYVAANMHSVINDDDDDSNSDDSNCVSPHSSLSCATVVSNTEIPASTVKQIKEKAGPAPFFEPHLWWHCSTDASNLMPLTINALIDPGAHAVLIHTSLVDTLQLHHHTLHKPKIIELVMDSDGKKCEVVLHEYIKLKLYDPSNYWRSQTIRALITPSLCAPVILGLPFLVNNHIVIDHADRTVIDKKSRFDLLNPKPPPLPVQPKTKLKDLFTKVMATCKLVFAELKLACHKHYQPPVRIEPVRIITAIWQTIENVAAKIDLEKMGTKMVTEYHDVFELIPHVNQLPTDIYCNIQLKDATQKKKTNHFQIVFHTVKIQRSLETLN